MVPEKWSKAPLGQYGLTNVREIEQQQNSSQQISHSVILSIVETITSKENISSTDLEIQHQIDQGHQINLYSSEKPITAHDKILL